MSYEQEMKWSRKHRKGTKLVIIMSTGSGFWPSGAFLEEWCEYCAECKKNGLAPLSCEAYYDSQVTAP